MEFSNSPPSRDFARPFREPYDTLRFGFIDSYIIILDGWMDGASK